MSKPSSDPPRSEGPSGKPAGAGHASLRHQPQLVLVVDDDPNIRESLAEVLRLENFAVRLACDGRDAVRQFLDGPPDLILLDINMPDISGWQAFQIMAEMYPFVPVIVITARPGQARRAGELGVGSLLEKPLHIPTLLQTMRRLLARPATGCFAKGG
ncbi:MAG TPA: response regulator [Verrucomicrobiae bacterium]|nr:response regulator [Verrucomicrobiae bacterium]